MQKSPINPFPNPSKINLYNRIKEYVNNVAKNHKIKPNTQPIWKTAIEENSSLMSGLLQHG